MKKLIMSSIVILSFFVSGAFAEGERHHKPGKNHHKPPVSRHVDQIRTENGFERNMTQTNDKGQTATKKTILVNDKENKVHTRTVSGTGYDGDTFSGEKVTRKTDNGFTEESTFTNAKGETKRRLVNAVVDREAGNITKNITSINEKGESNEKTIVKPLQHKHRKH